MSENAVTQKQSWTENDLVDEIARYRANRDDVGLRSFLLDRIEDDDPSCVHFRGKLLNEYGILLIAQQNTQEASDCFRKVLELDSVNVSALYNLGTLKMQQGDLCGAQEYFEAVLLEEHEHFSSLFNVGLCHLYQEKKEAALSFFLKAVEKQPGHNNTRYLTGEILMQLGRAEEALPHFRAAYRQNDSHFEITMGLAIALLQTGSYREVSMICDRALLVFGAATLPLQVKGDAMLALGEFEEAVMCHVDLCNLDLDIRDFVVTRLTRLADENPASFMAYSEVVHELFPSFKPILSKVAKN